MTQQIDPVKLKAAAEHLEWVCQQYPDNEDVQYMLNKLLPIIQDAKAGKITEIMNMKDVPFNWAVNSEGLYNKYRNPDIPNAYIQLQTELEGGLSDEDKEINVIIEGIKKQRIVGCSHE